MKKHQANLIAGSLAALAVIGVMAGIFLNPASSIAEDRTVTNIIDGPAVADSTTTAAPSYDTETSASSLIDESMLPVVRDDDEYTKSFLIAYPLAIPIETANKVSINDHPWLSKLVKNGEAIISSEELKNFVSKYRTSPDFAVLMEDGVTITYLNINWKQDILIPNVPYVKAYWEGELPSGVTSERANIGDIPALREAIEDKSQWIPLDSPDKAEAVERFLKNTSTRHFEVTLQNGVTELYHIRYIDASHTEIIG
jgi:hypothetical protein